MVHYFITVVAKKRNPVFGKIIGDEIQLPPTGEIHRAEFREISKRKSDIQIDEYQIMPDHIHMISYHYRKSENAPANFVTGLQPLVAGSIGSFMKSF
jgi:REP element-mobilizing transposase RayT